MPLYDLRPIYFTCFTNFGNFVAYLQKLIRARTKRFENTARIRVVEITRKRI
jgi:hypothetical protein